MHDGDSFRKPGLPAQVRVCLRGSAEPTEFQQPVPIPAAARNGYLDGVHGCKRDASNVFFSFDLLRPPTPAGKSGPRSPRERGHRSPAYSLVAMSDAAARLQNFKAFEDCAKVAKKKGGTAPKKGRIGLYALCSAVGPSGKDGQPRDGKMIWEQANQRRARLLPSDVEFDAPSSELSDVVGCRKETHVLGPWNAATAIRFVLSKESALSFFQDRACIAALEALITKGCGDEQEDLQRALKQLCVVAKDVEAAEERRNADRKELVTSLQPLISGNDMPVATLRASRVDGEVLGGVLEVLGWLNLDAKNIWNHWLKDAFLESLRLGSDLNQDEVIRRPVLRELKLPGNSKLVPMTNYAGYCLIIRLCVNHSSIAQAMADEALSVLGRVKIGDERLHRDIDANAAASSEPARAFVLGAEEATRQAPSATKRTRGSTSALDLDALEKAYLDDDTLEPDVVARRLAKISLARQYRETTGQHGALVKRQKVIEIENLEAESKSNRERLHAKTKVELARHDAEREKYAGERAKYVAERQAVEDDAKAASEERERQRIHAAELAEERRRGEIRAAAAAGIIAQEVADRILSENRKTPIVRFEQWIGRVCRCDAPSRCSSQLSKSFKEAVESRRHVKPASHWDAACQRWKYFEEHDGDILQELHQEIHDRRNHILPGQARLVFPERSS